ncbi:hypothetical protein RMN57_08500 [Kitasatospora sp. CM 4170]|uniref:Uncharacterized protein n=1 Tax=Kitasatospora aburaviensis TaxID=67265 RepID=A0ABW1FDB0_9ACTN|nr:hypothetical protein [Kitasatospora sp. CM 4170]WNM44753.1 hypothetical protein RMN57_08500 [Kitasatospora sp. CM 4170]
MSEYRTVVAVAEPNALPLRRRVGAPAVAAATGRAARRDRVEARAGEETGPFAAAAEPAGELALRTRAAHCRIALQYLD